MNLTGARAAAERLMVDSCTISRASASGQEYDAASDTFSGPSRTTVYTGPCRVKAPTGGDSRARAGDAIFTLDTFVVSIPVSSIDVHPGDHVIIGTAQDDPRMVGMALLVRSVTVGSQVTARRLTCEVMR